jgi:hypothetical protein
LAFFALFILRETIRATPWGGLTIITMLFVPVVAGSAIFQSMALKSWRKGSPERLVLRLKDIF